MKSSFLSLIALLALPAIADPRPIVVELYTSQGCSACPKADALLTDLATDPAILALSFHVSYFDYLGWKDRFAAPANGARQRAYVDALELDSLYTPQMIVDGDTGVVGSDAKSVDAAITAVRKDAVNVPVTIAPDATGSNLLITIAGNSPYLARESVAWEVHFNKSATVGVEAGENTGQWLESTNIVTRFSALTLVPGRANQYLLPLNFAEDGVAILVQKGPEGRILGAASYVKPRVGL